MGSSFITLCESDSNSNQQGSADVPKLSRSQRKQCHESRDVYFSCVELSQRKILETKTASETALKVWKMNPDERKQLEERIDKEFCSKAYQEFTQMCPGSWTVYFGRMRDQRNRQLAAEAAANSKT
mmetsp:Transcript_3017/g.5336  ORF Transcript_3017/g.5336 Transcript_3017/m.5336 type:complete len:126 (-) Transcript_3017:2046-2423(-)